MNVNLYANFAKRTNETLLPTGDGTQTSVVLKQATSITNPVFTLTGFNPSMNYLKVPDWSRNYFVTDFVKGNNDLYEVHCSEDFAGTWKGYIGSYNCFVERSASNYNVDLNDSAISSTEKIVNINSAKTALFGAGGMIVCRTINIDYGITTYMGSMETFKDLFTPISDDPNVLDTIEGILKYYLCNPGEYVLDCYFLAIPFSVLSSHMTTDILSSGWYANGGAYRWTSNVPTISDTVTIAKPTSYYTDFREGSNAFSNYTLYIPSVGTVPLPGELIDKTLRIKYTADIVTGEIAFNLLADGDVVATYHGNIKSGLQVGSMAPSGAALSSVAQGIAGIATGNPVMIGTAALTATQSIMQAPPSINGSPGSCCGIINEHDIVLTQMNKASADFPNTVGRPCCKNLTLGNLSGYIKCAGASIALPGTKTEIDAVNAMLNGGFYYT